MISVLFICHGNICRSPLAEYLFRYKVEQEGLEDKFYISSAATTNEDIGSPIDSRSRYYLDKLGIDSSDKRARQITKKDYDDYDYLIVMDKQNIWEASDFFGDDPKNKVKRLLEFAGEDRDIADPWYSGNFKVAYDDIDRGCDGLLITLKKEGNY